MDIIKKNKENGNEIIEKYFEIKEDENEKEKLNKIIRINKLKEIIEIKKSMPLFHKLYNKRCIEMTK